MSIELFWQKGYCSSVESDLRKEKPNNQIFELQTKITGLPIETYPRMASTCTGCRTNLSGQRKKYEWLVSRGYDVKDASAIVLHNPSSKAPIKQCCIVHLQTSVDTDKDVIERLEMKVQIKEGKLRARWDAAALAIIKRLGLNLTVDQLDTLIETRPAEILQVGEHRVTVTQVQQLIEHEFESDRVRQGLPLDQKEIVEIYATNDAGTVPGEFILYDAGFDDLSMLAPDFSERAAGNKGRGFKITDIGEIPTRIVNAENWGKATPVAIWSGNVKIIPVIRTGLTRTPAIMAVRRTTQVRELHEGHMRLVEKVEVEPLRKLDKTLLQGEIIYVTNQTMPFVNPYDPRVKSEFPTIVLGVEKEFADKIVA